MSVRPFGRVRRLAPALLALALLAAGPAVSPVVGARAGFATPQRLGFPAGDDWEPSVAADAYGHIYAFWTHYVGYAGANTGEVDPSCAGCGSPHMDLQISTDGGATWTAPRAPFPTTTRQDDPQIAVDPADGRTLYASYMQDDKSSQYVARSDDFGQSWHTVLVEQLKRGTDKDILAVRDGNVYLAYHTQQKVYVSYSHDGGATWALDNVLGTTNSTYGVSLPSGGAIAPDGRVYFAWNGVNNPGQAKGTVNLYVTASADGGLSWTTSLVDVSQAPPDCSCGGWDYWGPQMALGVDANAVVHVLWNANRSKDAPQRIYYARSTDGAATWSAPRDISGAVVGANATFPALVARGNGDVRIAWMDDRNGFDAGSGDPAARWNVWYRSSTDGGTTWSTERQLSAYVAGYPYSFASPRDGFLQPYGDYFEMDVTSSGDTVAVWGEGPSYAGPGNIWSTAGR